MIFFEGIFPHCRPSSSYTREEEAALAIYSPEAAAAVISTGRKGKRNFVCSTLSLRPSPRLINFCRPPLEIPSRFRVHLCLSLPALTRMRLLCRGVEIATEEEDLLHWNGKIRAQAARKLALRCTATHPHPKTERSAKTAI